MSRPPKDHLKALPALLLAGMVILSACGGGGSTGSDSGFGSGGIGGPNPEDVFDLPNSLPDDFALTECPTFVGLTNVRDLDVVINSPSAPTHDYDGDGDVDSILLVRGDASPKTVNIELHHRTSTPLPPTILDLGQPRELILGLEADENDVPLNPTQIGPSYSLIQEAWTPAYTHPIMRMTFIPNTPFGVPGLPEFPEYGFEGCDPLFLPACISTLGQGVYVVHARFADTLGIQHCTQESFKILVCPVAGHC